MYNVVKAQILHTVKSVYGAMELSNTEIVIFLKATIEPRWNIYSAYQKAGGPVKISFAFSASNDFETNGAISEPTPLTRYEDSFKMNVCFFEHKVISQKKITLKNSQPAVKGTVMFMVCNDRQCLPPEGINFEIPIK